MTPETVGLFAAILFLLIAVVGGGFTLKEVSMPAVPKWARVIAALLGVLFALPFALSLTGFDGDGDRDGDQASAAAPAGEGTQPSADAPAGGPATIHHDEQPDVSPEQIKLVEVKATSDQSKVTVGDRITVSFTIENVAEAPFQLSSTFVGARNPDDENSDVGEGNQDDVLEPGETLTVTATKLVNESGTWVFFPCYEFEENGEPAYCPNTWKGFEVLVGE
jgi:hypothetical protein